MRYKLFKTKVETNNGIVCIRSMYLDYSFHKGDGTYTRTFHACDPIEFWKGKFLKVEPI